MDFMKTFIDLSLSKDILKAIGELGFVSPTPIQELTIPAIISSSRDLIGLAQTGTGKTAGFGLPILQQINLNSKNIQAMILCPTRELCLQISNDLVSYSKYIDGLKVVSVYGGASIDTQIRLLKSQTHIIVGTPGRTLDLIKRKALNVKSIQWVVLDEADEMLNMGFREDLDAILENTPDDKQTLLFSATMPEGVKQISENYMSDPIEISSGKKNSGAENVLHHYYMVKASDRYIALKRLADINPDIYGIVFCRTREETKDVAAKLIEDGYNADALHGDLSQAQRDTVMSRFRNKQLQLLVATDVAARGIDVSDLTHVLNYNLPDDPELYIHRSGRTGRAGKEGVSIIISHSRDGRRIKELEKLIGKKFVKKLVPSGKDICEKRLFNMIDKVENIEVDASQIEPYMPFISQKLAHLDKMEILKRFVSVEFNTYLEYYRNAVDINVASHDLPEIKSKKGAGRKYVRFHINIGSKSNIKTADLIRFINEVTETRNVELGKIEILNNFSFFEVEEKWEQLIVQSFDEVYLGKTRITVQHAKPAPKSERFSRPNDRFANNDRFSSRKGRYQSDSTPEKSRRSADKPQSRDKKKRSKY